MAALGVLAGAFPGCASAPDAASGAPTTATLEVINRTGDALDVTVRDRQEIVVPPGARARVRHLVPGTAPVEAAATVGSARYSAELTLDTATVNRWDVAGEASDAPVPPGLGDLVVENPTGSALVVSADGRRLGRVFSGDIRRFRDVTAGGRVLTAVSDDGVINARDEQTVVADAETRWTVAVAGATIAVVNDTPEAVLLTIDQTPRGRIGAGETWRADAMTPGPHVLEAVSVQTRRRYETVVELSAEAPTMWPLTSGQAAVTLDNRTGEDLAFTRPTGGTEKVGPGAVVTFEGLPTGEQVIYAKGDSGTRYAVDVSLAPGQTYRWTVRPVVGTLRVVNRTRDDVVLYVAGEDRGVLAAGETGSLQRLPTGRFEVDAVDVRGEQRYTFPADLTEIPSTTWIIQPVLGSVFVDNRRPEAVDVYVDAQRVGRLEAATSQTFTGVPVGRARLVEAVGARSAAVLRETVAVTEVAAASVTLEDPTGTLVIVNDTGRELRTTGLLESQQAALAAGDSARFRLPIGPRTVGLVGADGTRYGRELTMPSGGVITWPVSPSRATLIAWNRLGESIAVAIDGRAIGSVDPGGQLVVADLSTGKHELSAVGLTSNRIFHERRLLSAGAPEAWNVNTRPARMVVVNETHERLEIAIDDWPYGHVEPDTPRIFPEIWPGAHTVVAVGAKSRVRHAISTTFTDGRDELIVIKPPMGHLIMDNATQGALTVLVDGREVARVAPNAGPKTVSVAAGSRFVQIGRADGSISGFSVDVAAGHAVHLPIADARVRIVVVNQTERTLSLAANSADLGDIEAGASRLLEDLDPGETELVATDADGQPSHREARTLHAGETATWVLQAP